MTTPETPILDERAVSEIEALSAKVPDGPWFTAPDDAEDVPDHRRSGLALVETGRSADWWIARLCEWHIANFIAESKSSIDALCATVKHLRADAKLVDEYVAEVKRELGMKPNWHLSITLERYKEKVQSEVRAEMQSQLEQLRAENERLQESLAAEVAKRINANVERMEQSQKVSQSEIRPVEQSERQQVADSKRFTKPC